MTHSLPRASPEMIEDSNASRELEQAACGPKAAPVFVFGSNLAGRHGKGAALWAVQHRGATYGIGEGRMGNSYALPTKDHRIRTLPLEEIERRSVPNFLAYARCHPELTFQLTPVGCGLAGYTPAQIAPMFRWAPDNVLMPAEFTAALAAASPTERPLSPRETK